MRSAARRGFCFLNNAGIAAEALRLRGLRPAILDVDLHHGNGTQGIFYARKDVLTVSIHADPARFYPFYGGHAHGRGAGGGLGYTLTLPLPASCFLSVTWHVRSSRRLPRVTVVTCSVARLSRSAIWRR